ncbi:hypothetical protein GCM10009602_49400 [Nocardiopsis tropica]
MTYLATYLTAYLMRHLMGGSDRVVILVRVVARGTTWRIASAVIPVQGMGLQHVTEHPSENVGLPL